MGEKLNKDNYLLFDNDKLQDFVDEDASLYFTENPEIAMFLAPNGKMISSHMYGIRVEDHNIIRSYFEYLDNDEIFDLPISSMRAVTAATTGIVIMIPETETALCAKNQLLTDIQKETIENAAFDLDYFSEGISQDQALEKLDIDPEEIEQMKDKSAAPSYSY